MARILTLLYEMLEPCRTAGEVPNEQQQMFSHGLVPFVAVAKGFNVALIIIIIIIIITPWL
jgi:hypothetical protein